MSQMETGGREMEAIISSIANTVNFPLDPTDLAENCDQFFDELNQKILAGVPQTKSSKPLFEHNLSDEEWAIVADYANKLNEEFEQRAQLMLKRLDVTFESFLWSDRIKKFEDKVMKMYRPARDTIATPQSVNIDDLLAATSDLLYLEKTVSKGRQATCNSVLGYTVKDEPSDRGGRTSEMMAPPPEISAWQQRSRQPARGSGYQVSGGRGSGGYQGGRGGVQPRGGHRGDFRSKTSSTTVLSKQSNLLLASVPSVRPSSSDVYQHLHHEFRIDNLHTANQLVNHFTPEERSLLLRLLTEKAKEDEARPDHKAAYHNDMFKDDIPTFKQLKELAIINTIPFIGFGILDNMIMIMAGEYIDQTLGILFSISTMAAAALGNIISDVAGVGLAHYVEIFVTKLGFKHPELNAKQHSSKRARTTVNVSRAMGLIIGCVIGMFPLLFFPAVDSTTKPTDPKS
ncbi:transmembrane protein 65 domain-containing protein [Ditylenchus destructor]|uniref:Transmembrane protein 65 domain-containing protein n=1 Tax=Ditylenchus destructor TaxID=166010 RepID=A0AAD4NAY2_9BILA|nr:transmembrane protein 65 domain-containing protein [Ditylenchus destructor]